MFASQEENASAVIKAYHYYSQEKKHKKDKKDRD